MRKRLILLALALLLGAVRLRQERGRGRATGDLRACSGKPGRAVCRAYAGAGGL